MASIDREQKRVALFLSALSDFSSILCGQSHEVFSEWNVFSREQPLVGDPNKYLPAAAGVKQPNVGQPDGDWIGIQFPTCERQEKRSTLQSTKKNNYRQNRWYEEGPSKVDQSRDKTS